MLRIDDLQYKGLKLYQDTNGFCFGTDAVLLAAFAAAVSVVVAVPASVLRTPAATDAASGP